jgi:hypothetical protein
MVSKFMIMEPGPEKRIAKLSHPMRVTHQNSLSEHIGYR